MSSLALQQQALLDALFAWPAADAALRLSRHAVGAGLQPQRGLRAYQANGHYLAQRALGAAYPVVAQLLGVESFADLARALWHAHPPVCGDVARWGAQLAEFIQASAQLQDTPYLPDVAHAEWALHCCACAPDIEADLGTLALLTTEAPESLGLTFAPGFAILGSSWPVASLVLAHLEQRPSLAEVGDQLRSQIAQVGVVWRAGLQPRLRQALPGERTLLSAICEGLALGPAVAQAEALDFSQWLPMAVQSGLVLGAYRLSPPLTEEQP